MATVEQWFSTFFGFKDPLKTKRALLQTTTLLKPSVYVTILLMWLKMRLNVITLNDLHSYFRNGDEIVTKEIILNIKGCCNTPSMQVFTALRNGLLNLRWFTGKYSARRLIGISCFCNQILLVPLCLAKHKKMLVYSIIRFILSL